MKLNDIAFYVDDRPAEGVFRVHRAVYTDPGLFELEQRFIFEKTWNFLGLESQIPAPHDYVTTRIGVTPVILMRSAAGELGAFVNVCRHKGAKLCHAEQGNAKYHVCPYHGWAYGSDGRNVDIKDRRDGRYPAAFDAESHDLLTLPHVASYKGLVFGTLSADAPALENFLGDMRIFLDLVMDQGPRGMEFVPGRAAYIYRANWKLQMDNGVDPYHLTTTHTSYMQLQARRRKGEGHLEARQFDWARRASADGGGMSFAHGHSLIWLDQTEPEKRPAYHDRHEIAARTGPLRTEWMIKARNVQVFPNLQIADAISLMLRVFHPVAADRTEMRSYCLAPVGEDPERRAWRLRQFEDFFNPGGMATPDDTVIYEECQRGLSAQPLGFLQGFSRGLGALQGDDDPIAASLGVRPHSAARGPFEMFNEVAFHGPYREWARMLEAGLSGRPAYP
jgi:benzoate/toluate 1,2-dioxygenase alpha subunit